MDAKEALEITNQNWIDNEEKLSELVIGWESKVREAAGNGKYSCSICVIDMNKNTDFIVGYFEKLGYYVILRQVSPTEILIGIDWHIIPYTSRCWTDNEKFIREILDFS